MDGIRRVQIDFSADAFDQLERIQELAGASSRVETIRNALQFFHWFVEQKHTGSRFLVGNTEGALKEVEFLIGASSGAGLAPEVSKGNVAAMNSVSIGLIDPAVYRALRQHPELLRTLDWRTFEKLLADILERMGYEIELRRGTKDGGIDIIAVKKLDILGPHRYLLQAKKWSHRVGIEPVRELLFLHNHEHATKSCLATTSRFTKGAWQLANQYGWQLELRDFDGIHEWISKLLRDP